MLKDCPHAPNSGVIVTHTVRSSSLCRVTSKPQNWLHTAVPCSNSDKTPNFIWLTPTVNFSSYPDSAFPRFLNFHHSNRIFFCNATASQPQSILTHLPTKSHLFRRLITFPGFIKAAYINQHVNSRFTTLNLQLSHSVFCCDDALLCLNSSRG
jgi:hypothetical protein